MKRKIDVALSVIINDKNEILVTQRFDPETPAIHLQWQLPGGGIEKGETKETACIREALEETGLSISLLTKTPAYIRHEFPDQIFHLYGFMAKAESGTINVSLDEETNDAKWLPLEEIKTLNLMEDTFTMIEQCIEIWKKN